MDRCPFRVMPSSLDEPLTSEPTSSVRGLVSNARQRRRKHDGVQLPVEGEGRLLPTQARISTWPALSPAVLCCARPVLGMGSSRHRSRANRSRTVRATSRRRRAAPDRSLRRRRRSGAGAPSSGGSSAGIGGIRAAIQSRACSGGTSAQTQARVSAGFSVPISSR